MVKSWNKFWKGCDKKIVFLLLHDVKNVNSNYDKTYYCVDCQFGTSSLKLMSNQADPKNVVYFNSG